MVLDIELIRRKNLKQYITILKIIVINNYVLYVELILINKIIIQCNVVNVTNIFLICIVCLNGYNIKINV